jgi:hypothetical protein
VSIHVGGVGNAAIMHLTGRSLDSTEGVAIQGETVDRNGHLHPHPCDHVRIHDGMVNLDLASGSAVVITLDGHA